ncbi:39S ribosomal protein L47, mitochondrial [Galemys pyrenaicus]|uniref:Large ribosomal subunit protein uL29m n=1 Tax=Galemys pyrenaicus TaxID=202257 RepID=A0A8J6A9W1_GALPY|nr:39S ribosomal protein L47, mitochondrial [Galemys pyrenaicus]
MTTEEARLEMTPEHHVKKHKAQVRPLAHAHTLLEVPAFRHARRATGAHGRHQRTKKQLHKEGRETEASAVEVISISNWVKVGALEARGTECRLLHTTLSRKGLEEFFDDPKNWGQEKVKSGASWTCQQLRNKSNEDLHKLWYVLLKERNMLLALEQEAKRQSLPMPSPERLEKVIDSMDALDKVVQERKDAIRLLQTGQEKARPGAWRRDIFGRIIWHKFSGLYHGT